MKFKFIKLIISTLILAMTFSCTKTQNENSEHYNISSNSNIESKYGVDYKYYDVFNFKTEKIIIPKNQTISQSLSVLVNDGEGNLIVFDGGRVEDADYLCNIIKDNGGVVKHWFITHIHDDHIGALYKILADKRNDVVIENLFYDFADFDWYYEKMGNDSGIYFLFTNALNEYNNFLNETGKNLIEISDVSRYQFPFFYKYKWYNNELKKWENITSSKVAVKVLNNHYELDRDPINNTSITYMVEIGKTSLLIFGDLGYDGGNKLFYECFKWKGTPYPDGSGYYKNDTYEAKDDFISGRNFDNIDIIQLAHHGQNGIDPEIYKKLKPKVVIWPTSKDVYENAHGTYLTDETKKALKEIDSIKYEFKSYEETAVLR